MELEELEKNIKTMLDDMPKIVKEFAGEDAEVIIEGVKEKTSVVTGTLRKSWHSKVTNGGV